MKEYHAAFRQKHGQTWEFSNPQNIERYLTYKRKRQRLMASMEGRSKNFNPLTRQRSQDINTRSAIELEDRSSISVYRPTGYFDQLK